MDQRRRSSVAFRIALSLAVLVVALTAVAVGVVGLFRGSGESVSCPAARSAAGAAPCVDHAG
jgi:hypothetical protein